MVIMDITNITEGTKKDMKLYMSQNPTGTMELANGDIAPVSREPGEEWRAKSMKQRVQLLGGRSP